MKSFSFKGTFFLLFCRSLIKLSHKRGAKASWGVRIPLHPRVNFTNILWAAFTCGRSYKCKKDSQVKQLLHSWDLQAVKLHINTLMKLTPREVKRYGMEKEKVGNKRWRSLRKGRLSFSSQSCSSAVRPQIPAIAFHPPVAFSENKFDKEKSNCKLQNYQTSCLISVYLLAIIS